MNAIDKDTLFGTLPSEWPYPLLSTIQQRVAESGRKIVVLDDDPTGTQTVHGVPVLTEWPVAALAAELQRPTSCFYLLTNSRSLPLSAARALNTEIGSNLVQAGAQTSQPFVVISRSDSTLRGHFPGEIDALSEALGSDFDSCLIIPYFLEGGRYTVRDTHYVAEGETLVPAGETAYAWDASFGYTMSDLREWVAEKTSGRVRPTDVATISLDDIRRGGPDQVTRLLVELHRGTYCIVNAAADRDLEVLVLALLEAESRGRRFLYRTAASFVRVRAGITPRPLLVAQDMALSETGGGLFVVGSYVPKSTSQLIALMVEEGIVLVELDARLLLDDSTQYDAIAQAAMAAGEAVASGYDTVIATSRDLVTGSNAEKSLAIGRRISDGLTAVMQSIDIPPRYIVAKGGVTSSDIATLGLGVKRAEVLGQILPGVPVWQLGAETRFPGVPYIVFPGNVGDVSALAQVRTMLRSA